MANTPDRVSALLQSSLLYAQMVDFESVPASLNEYDFSTYGVLLLRPLMQYPINPLFPRLLEEKLWAEAEAAFTNN